jgi:hypothetical protein
MHKNSIFIQKITYFVVLKHKKIIYSYFLCKKVPKSSKKRVNFQFLGQKLCFIRRKANQMFVHLQNSVSYCGRQTKCSSTFKILFPTAEGKPNVRPPSKFCFLRRKANQMFVPMDSCAKN